MSCEGLSRYEAWWHTPVVTALRLQKAYLERQGEEQQWTRSALDRITERLDATENGE